jgi:hypothetical protein
VLLCQNCDSELIEPFAGLAMLSSLHFVSCALAPERCCKRRPAAGVDELGNYAGAWPGFSSSLLRKSRSISPSSASSESPMCAIGTSRWRPNDMASRFPKGRQAELAAADVARQHQTAATVPSESLDRGDHVILGACFDDRPTVAIESM